MDGESNQNVFLIQIDASSFAEFDISESEISRVDCTPSKKRKAFVRVPLYLLASLCNIKSNLSSHKQTFREGKKKACAIGSFV